MGERRVGKETSLRKERRKARERKQRLCGSCKDEKVKESNGFKKEITVESFVL